MNKIANKFVNKKMHGKQIITDTGKPGYFCLILKPFIHNFTMYLHVTAMS